MDRRNFIKAAGAGLALAAAPQITSAKSLISSAKPGKKKAAGLKLSFFPYELKLRHAFNLAKSSRTVTPDVQVQIEYDGITGYGEASMPPYLGESVESVTKFLGSLDLAQFTDPFRIDDILDYVDNVAPKNPAAKASVDIALHDLLGKIMNQPWYKIWGLSPEKAPCTSFTIGIDKADVVRQKVQEAAPYKILKVKMGLDNDKEEALRMIDWLAERNCLFVEQPLPKEKFEETAWLRDRSPLPIIADEAFQRIGDIPRLQQAYDGINIKLMKSTGLHEAYKMAIIARSLGMKVMVGCMTETSCGISAAAQIAPLVDWADLDGNLLIANDRFEGMKIVDGKITLSQYPGIGAKLLKE